MSVRICNHFHARQASSGKMTSFWGWGVLLFHALVRGNPHHRGHEISSQKIGVFGAAHSENIVIIACTVLTGRQFETDRLAPIR